MLLLRFLTLSIASLALTIGGTALAAHDLWIDPTSFSPERGQIVGVRLRVGQDLLGDPVPRSTPLINQFIVADATGRTPLVGRDGADPAGYLRIARPGLHVVGYQSNPSPVVLAAEKFNQYLTEEGLDGVVAERARRRETGREAREIFSRCAKALVLSGPASEAEGDRLLGFPLELFAERNPYTVKAGQDLPVRLTYERQPLAGALVVAFNKMNPADKVSARTDANGRVRLPLTRHGMWLVKAVHMVPAPAGSNADWASFWASLTFDLQNAATTGSGEAALGARKP